jgi:hypothetical protein
MMRLAIDAARAAGVRRLLLIANVYAFGRPVAPLVLIAVLRRDWGTTSALTQLMQHALQWAIERPETDWGIISNVVKGENLWQPIWL